MKSTGMPLAIASLAVIAGGYAVGENRRRRSLSDVIVGVGALGLLGAVGLFALDIRELDMKRKQFSSQGVFR